MGGYYSANMPLGSGRLVNLFEDLLQLFWRHDFKLVDLHGERGPALSQGTQSVGIPEQLRNRRGSVDQLKLSQRTNIKDLPAVGGEVTDDRPDQGLRDGNFQGRDRLQQVWFGALHRLFQSHRAGDAKCGFSRFMLMKSAICDSNIDVSEAITGEWAIVQRISDPLLSGGKKTLRDRPLGQRIDNSAAVAAWPWRDLDGQPGILYAGFRFMSELTDTDCFCGEFMDVVSSSSDSIVRL